MSTLAYILALAFSGLIVGALARLVLPGRDPMTIFETMIAGVAGSLIAGLVAFYVFDHSEGPGLLLALACTVMIVFAVRKIRERDAATRGGVAPSLSARQTQVRFLPGCLVTSLLLSLGLTLILNLLVRAF